MDHTFSILIALPSIGIVFLFVFATFRFIYREKFAQSLLGLPEANKERFLQYERRMVKLLKITLWPALLLSILVPVTAFLLSREYFLLSIVGMVLFLIITLQEYGFRKWLLNYLETKELIK